MPFSLLPPSLLWLPLLGHSVSPSFRRPGCSEAWGSIVVMWLVVGFVVDRYVVQIRHFHGPPLLHARMRPK